jgi:hypothetical protein
MNIMRLAVIGITLCLVIDLRAVRAQQQPMDLAAGFASPPASAQPNTWWHWMNGNVSKEGITLDLEAMKRLGIGGFQLFQVGSGIPKGPVPFGTPENTQLLQWAAHEADRLGLTFTMHNCPGWSSSGGPWITPELSMQVLVMTETSVEGGKKLSVALPQPQATRDYYKDAFVIAYPTPSDASTRIANWSNKANFPGGRGARGAAGARGPTTNATPESPAIDPEKVIDISQFMDAQGQLNWDAPAGNWTILRIGHTSTGVENRPPPDGGAGLECDKFSREAMDFHFNHFFGEMFEAIKPLAAKGMAGALIDSYETGLQNWTPLFPQEFKKRMGYDIRNYMPVVFGRMVGSLDRSERFLWDFRKVQADLMAENYYGRFAELCHEHGMLAFNEPYDPGNFDEMAVGRFADMPMGEFWQGQANQHSIKLVASVAHVNGRAVVGAESFTSQSRWTEYPYSLKALGDFMYTQGLNRYIFHRFAMQPNPTAVPGMTMGPWGGHFDRTNTWFQHGAQAWLQYVARCQFVLQQGKFHADLLFFAGEDSPQRTPERAALGVPAGYDFDTIDAGSILNRVKIENGRIVLPDGMSYSVMVLPEKRTMTLELARKIRELVQQGMILSVSENRPQGTPGLKDFPASNDEVKRIVAEIWGNTSGKVLVGQTPAQVLGKLGIKPDFESTSRSGTAQINFIHRTVGDAQVYFVANRNEQQREDLVCTFDVSGKQPELWDPVGGTMSPAAVYDIVEGRTRMPIQLDPSESVFVVFRNAAPARHIQMISKDGTTLASVEPLASAGPTTNARGGSLARGQQQAMAMPGASDPQPLILDGGSRGQMLAFANGNYTLRDNQGLNSTVRVTGIADPVEVTGAWHITFPPNLGAPAQADFEKLMSWSDSSDDGVKHFSGTATYTKKISIPADALSGGKRVFLDLGKVQVLAEVILNGKNLGILWDPPFRIDITDAAKAGENDLELRVTNLWPNRLIGDEQLPPENDYYGFRGGRGATTGPATAPAGAARGTNNAIIRIPDWYSQGLPKPPGGRVTFTTWHHWSADAPLLESGLIGPVKIRTAVVIATDR